MKNKDKIELLNTQPPDGSSLLDYYYGLFEQTDAIKYNYNEYMTTGPINCDQELKRLDGADYDLCCALMTMLLRENRFAGRGCFERRYKNGDVQKIINRITEILKEEK